MKKMLRSSLFSLLSCTLLLSGCGSNSIGLNENSVGAATDLFKAATLTDDEVKQIAKNAAKELDTNNKMAAPSDKYGSRLAKITKGLDNEDGIALNFKVYMVKDVNAFAMADGTVRVFAGLMDLMTDDEVRFIIGHEIGHAKLGHIKKATQTAYTASAARKGAAASGNQTVSALSASELGALGEELINAQFSQSQESDSDAYGVAFMKKHKFNLNAAVSAMEKLQGSGDSGHSMLSSHPSSADRVAKLKELIQAK